MGSHRVTLSARRTNIPSSDLLDELDLPASGILLSEARIGIPKGRFTLKIPSEFSATRMRMMCFYSAHIHLRKILNRVRTESYKARGEFSRDGWGLEEAADVTNGTRPDSSVIRRAQGLELEPGAMAEGPPCVHDVER